ncbi:conserved exported hypothetical protein [Candidatus Sulfotelmatomonas gaucii]|uniref:TonB-dependent transporter Oar-like beta-barrel domain-containing protein n=1 Tax=Candidatus Sulfuritelmatomonas gaucii TaxID=2043161 RepID=A0A2N9LHT4_9BACT|nr:conserved exported hypothetical protein [Candidatus Sulfotelmatomonas gaucii]
MTKICSFFPRILAAFALTAFFVAPAGVSAWSQTTGAGSINGAVTDVNQAVIPTATVTVINVDTGVTHLYSTDSAGYYSAPFLIPGHYEVDASAPNFGKVEEKGVTLLVGQTVTINLTLKISAATTTVEVSASNLILDVEKTEVSQVVDTNLVANLPVNARNWSDFVLLTPNVTQDGSSGLVSFHGISGLYNQNYVDGANNNQMLFSEARGRASGAPYVYSVDSIKEFQANASNYSVEFGQAAGGQVNAITKSGTNNLHGDLFYFLRYPSLNALDPYTKYQALNPSISGVAPAAAAFLLTQPTHQQQQFGGSVGGPFIKDRLFYFLTYDGFRKVGKALYTDNNYLSTSSTLPAGVSPGSNTIYAGACPATITATQCTNGIQFLINESTAAPTRFSKEDVFFPRLDFHINSKNDAFVNYNWVDFYSAYGYSSAVTFSNSSPSTNAPTYYHERFLVAGWTTQIGSASVNEVHGQYGRDLETAGANASGPSVGMGVDTFGMPNALPRKAEPDEHRIQISDVFSTTHGRHTWKFGGDANIIHEVMINLFQGGGIYSYGDSTNLLKFQSWIQDAFAGQAGDTDPYAGYHYSTLVQTVDQVNTTPGTQGKDDFWMKMYDGYAEDAWKIGQKFTVTAGIRYDIQLTPNPGLVNHLFDPISSEYTSSIKNVTDRIQPRVAFSWTPYNGTVVRGGYGLFSALNQGSTYYAMRVENGVVQLNYTYTGCFSSTAPNQPPNTPCPSVPGTGTTAAKLRYPNLPVQPSGPSLSSAQFPTGGAAPGVTPITAAPSYSFHGLDPNFVPPFAHEMNLSLEQALPGKLSLQVGYVGTRGMRLPVFLDAELVGQQPHGLATYLVQDASNNITKTITAPVYLPTDRRPALNSAGQQLSSFNTGYSIANTWYNAMAVTVRRPFANGIEVLGNYTWAHASDDGQVQGANGTFYGGDVPTDPNNIRFDNGPSDIDIRNRGSITFVYQPTFKVSNMLANQLANGWQFSGAEIASNGEPIFLGVSGTIYSGNTVGSSYADESGIFGGAMSSSTGSATNGRPPQVGRNSIPMPGFNDFDMRLTRNIKIHENISLQLNAEAFNLLNHKIVTGVNGTYTTFLGPGAKATAGSATYTCATVTPPTGSRETGCFVPYTGTLLSTFDVTSSTSSSTLYGSRQLQVSGKLFF